MGMPVPERCPKHDVELVVRRDERGEFELACVLCDEEAELAALAFEKEIAEIRKTTDGETKDGED